MKLKLSIGVLLYAVTLPTLAATYDLVIKNGRVMDPETELDAIRDVAIQGNRIKKISRQKLKGRHIIDAENLVVAPGFIDTHVHGQTQFGSKLMLRDGVTTTLDMEVGGYNINKWYAARKDNWQTNYGITVSHEYARMTVLDGLEFPDPMGAQQIGPVRAAAEKNNGVPDFAVTLPSHSQLNEIVRRVDEQLRQGGLGLGSTIGYMAKGVRSQEMWELQKVSAAYHRGSYSHVRFLGNNLPPTEGTLGLAEALANALSLKAPFMAVHDNNRGWWENEEKLARARAQGFNVWSEYYPYISGSGPIGSEFLRPETLKNEWGLAYENSMLNPATGTFYTEHAYQQKRDEDPGYIVVLFMRQREPWLPQWLLREHATVGSDSMPTTDIDGNDLTWDDPYGAFVGHPRTAGSHAKVLRLGREHGVPLMQTLRQLSYWSALHLGESGITAMQERGRMQPGMVADITIFDPKTVTDKATHEYGKQGTPSTGIPYVIVGGELVVNNSRVEQTFPGQPIRFEEQDEGHYQPIEAF